MQQPDKQIKEALQLLKSSDWQKGFQACNVLKRAVVHHRSNLVQMGVLGELSKDLVKAGDSLRSQLSKNALLTVSIIFEHLGRQMDSQIDTFLMVLIKKAADTNSFIAEEGINALAALCHSCSEIKVFTSLQNLNNIRANPMKIKLAFAYNELIDKLGSRVSQFRELSALVKQIACFLNEGAIEIRNVAKRGLFML